MRVAQITENETENLKKKLNEIKNKIKKLIDIEKTMEELIELMSKELKKSTQNQFYYALDMISFRAGKIPNELALRVFKEANKVKKKKKRENN